MHSPHFRTRAFWSVRLRSKNSLATSQHRSSNLFIRTGNGYRVLSEKNTHMPLRSSWNICLIQRTHPLSLMRFSCFVCQSGRGCLRFANFVSRALDRSSSVLNVCECGAVIVSESPFGNVRSIHFSPSRKRQLLTRSPESLTRPPVLCVGSMQAGDRPWRGDRVDVVCIYLRVQYTSCCHQWIGNLRVRGTRDLRRGYELNYENVQRKQAVCIQQQPSRAEADATDVSQQLLS